MDNHTSATTKWGRSRKMPPVASHPSSMKVHADQRADPRISGRY
jgi:hypothetical protein